MFGNLWRRLASRNLHKHGQLSISDFIGQSAGKVRPCYLCGELCLKAEMAWVPTDGMMSDLMCKKCVDYMFGIVYLSKHDVLYGVLAKPIISTMLVSRRPLSYKAFVLICVGTGVFVFVITLSMVFSPLIYAFVLQKVLGLQVDVNTINQLTNGSIINACAIALSLVAILATIIGLYWQFKQTEAGGIMKGQLQDIRDRLSKIDSGQRLPTTELPPSTPPATYAPSGTTGAGETE